MNTHTMPIPSNRVCDIERYGIAQLTPAYGEGEAQQLTRMLFEAYLGWSLAQLLLHRQECINQSDLLRFYWAIEDLKKFRPIQHIIGYTFFYDCKIHVTPDTLIPRPETEELVSLTIEKVSGHCANVLDLCTGSGCIAIALAKGLQCDEVHGLDISAEALAIARQNAKENGVAIDFLQADILNMADKPFNGKNFDLIISNPPYIKETERQEMRTNVLNYEPALALFVPDNNPLLFYDAIATFARKHLNENGLLALEINEKLGAETVALMKQHGLSPTLQNDAFGKERFIFCSRQ